METFNLYDRQGKPLSPGAWETAGALGHVSHAHCSTTPRCSSEALIWGLFLMDLKTASSVSCQLKGGFSPPFWLLHVRCKAVGHQWFLPK